MGKTFYRAEKYINVLAPRSYDDSRGKRIKKSSKNDEPKISPVIDFRAGGLSNYGKIVTS